MKERRGTTRGTKRKRQRIEEGQEEAMKERRGTRGSDEREKRDESRDKREKGLKRRQTDETEEAETRACRMESGEREVFPCCAHDACKQQQRFGECAHRRGAHLHATMMAMMMMEMMMT
jgi:hypothetical protein